MALENVGLPAVAPVFTERVPLAFTVTALALRFATAVAETVPALMTMPPLKVLVPERASVPVSALVMPVVPAMAPGTVSVVPTRTSNPPPPVPRVTPRLVPSVRLALLFLRMPPPERAMFVALKAPGVAPSAASVSMRSVPPLIVVPPVYAFAPVSASTPAPDFTRALAVVPSEMMPPSVSWPLVAVIVREVPAAVPSEIAPVPMLRSLVVVNPKLAFHVCGLLVASVMAAAVLLPRVTPMESMDNAPVPRALA